MAMRRSTTGCIVGEFYSKSRTLQAADVLRDELLGIEIERVSWAALAEVGQYGHGRLVGDEDMQPPAAIGTRLQMVQEAAVAMLG